MDKLPIYPEDHPVCLALTALGRAARTGDFLLKTLCTQAKQAGVPYGGEVFDQAADLAGIPYCRPLDLYVDREVKRQYDAKPFAHQH